MPVVVIIFGVPCSSLMGVGPIGVGAGKGFQLGCVEGTEWLEPFRSFFLG